MGWLHCGNTYIVIYFCWTGFVEKEIKKANIPTVDTGENPEVPFPRDMIDLEVICYLSLLLSGIRKPNGITRYSWGPISLLKAAPTFISWRSSLLFHPQGRQEILIIFGNMASRRSLQLELSQSWFCFSFNNEKVKWLCCGKSAHRLRVE